MKARRFAGALVAALLICVSTFSHAQWTGVFNPMVMQRPSAAGVASVVYVDDAVSNVAGNTTTFTGINFGSAASSRKIVIGVGRGPTGAFGTVSSVTIGGIAATFINSAATTTEDAELWIAAVPTGTSGTVAVTWTNSATDVGLGVWALYNTSITPTDTASDNNSNPATDTINIAAGGAAVGYVYHRSNTDPTTFSWSNLTEDFDVTVQAGGNYNSGASAFFSSAQSGLAISVTSSDAGVRSPVLVVASFPRS